MWTRRAWLQAHAPGPGMSRVPLWTSARARAPRPSWFRKERRRRDAAAAAALLAEEKRRNKAAAAADDKRFGQEQARGAAEKAEAARLLREERDAVEGRVREAVKRAKEEEHKKRLEEWRALNRDYPVPEYLKPYISEVLESQAADEGQKRKANVGVLGNSGKGKSSLIKAMFLHVGGGEGCGHPKPVFEGDGTLSPTPYDAEAVLGIDLGGATTIWDLPGQGTDKFRAETYLRDMGLKYFDDVLVCTDGRWTEQDSALYEAIKSAEIPCSIVRTKVDLAVADGAADEGWTQEESLENVRRALLNSAPEKDATRFHLVTARRKFWTGAHGGPPFGQVDGLCDQVWARLRMLSR